MVNFDANLVYDDGENVIGWDVIVTSEAGDVIGSVAVTDQTTISSLQEDLEDLSDSMISMDDVLAVLLNASETNTINATTLNSYDSDDFSKTNHTHLKNKITDLYSTTLELSSYNVNIDSSVTVTATLKDMDGNVVPNKILTVYKNGESVYNGATNVNGVITFTETMDEWGVFNFSCNDQVVSCNVTGWKKITGTVADQYYNEEYAYLVMHYGSSVPDGTTINLSNNMAPVAGIPTFTSANRQYTVKIEGGNPPKATIMLNNGASNASVYGAVLYRRA